MLVYKSILKRFVPLVAANMIHNDEEHLQVLSPFFGGMISFVKDNEGYLERGEMSRINVNESKMFFNK